MKHKKFFTLTLIPWIIVHIVDWATTVLIFRHNPSFEEVNLLIRLGVPFELAILISLPIGVLCYRVLFYVLVEQNLIATLGKVMFGLLTMFCFLAPSLLAILGNAGLV